jgi:uncharacterized membrane protein
MTLLETVCLVLYAGIYLYVLKHIDFKLMLEHKRIQHLVLGAGVVVFVLWLFRAGIYDGLSVHFLWLSALALTLGFRYAVFISGLVLLGITIIGKESWGMLGANGLFGVLVPIGLTYTVFTLSFHKIMRNMFVYVFVCAFFPAALGIAIKMGLIGGFYTLNGTYPWDVVVDNYEVLIPLMLFPEAMLNGMTMTLLVIYKPDWVYTFNDKHYFDPDPE